MSRNTYISSVFGRRKLIYSLVYFSHLTLIREGREMNAVQLKLEAYGSRLPFYSDEKQAGEKERPRKTKRKREREKEKGVSGQNSSLVIRVTLGMIPPSAEVWPSLWPRLLPETHTELLSAIVKLMTVSPSQMHILKQGSPPRVESAHMRI